MDDLEHHTQDGSSTLDSSLAGQPTSAGLAREANLIQG